MARFRPLTQSELFTLNDRLKRLLRTSDGWLTSPEREAITKAQECIESLSHYSNSDESLPGRERACIMKLQDEMRERQRIENYPYG